MYLDENGNVTGEKRTRSEVHSKGLWHKAVHIWIVNDKRELILQKRSHEKITNPDMWNHFYIWTFICRRQLNSWSYKRIK